MSQISPVLRAIFVSFYSVSVLVIATVGATSQTADLFTGFQTNSTDPVQIDAASLEISEEGKQRVSVFDGNVIVRRGETILRAKTISVFSDLSDKRPKDQAFSRIEATGNIEVSSGEQTVTGAGVVVDMGNQTITMSGNVVLSQGSSIITGDRLIIYLATGRARIEQATDKPIRGVFTPGAGSLSKPSQ